MQRAFAARRKLLRAIRRRSYRLIAVDGTLGAGKTTLAAFLGRRLGTKPVHLDQHVAKRRGAYVQHIKRTHVQRLLDRPKPVLVDGICVLQVLATLGVQPDLHLYVKRIKDGRWIDEEELDLHEPVETYLSRLHEQVTKMAAFLGSTGRAASSSVSDEVIRYHAEWRPHQRAQLLYLRDDA